MFLGFAIETTWLPQQYADYMVPERWLETNRLRYSVCRDPDLTSQAGFVGAQSGLVDIQLNSGDQLK